MEMIESTKSEKKKLMPAKLEGESGKLFVPLPGIKRLLSIMPVARVLIGDAVLRVKPIG